MATPLISNGFDLARKGCAGRGCGKTLSSGSARSGKGRKRGQKRFNSFLGRLRWKKVGQGGVEKRKTGRVGVQNLEN